MVTEKKRTGKKHIGKKRTGKKRICTPLSANKKEINSLTLKCYKHIT